LAQTWAIVVAAGEGRRFGADRPKAFIGFNGQVLLGHAVALFDDHDEVDRMVLVVPAGWEEPAELLADQLAAGKVASVIAGGNTRAESVAVGLAELPEAAGTVLVHDAARPLASPALVSRVLGALANADGAVPAVPVADTIKRISGEAITSTLARDGLVAVQTPQAFRVAKLKDAYDRPLDELRAATDCSSLLEQAGMSVAWVEGERANLKITEPDDLRLAGAFL
jgi:2-C-methyl-D-erythritol 4-phosphate cytidylyltransferase